MRADDSYSPSTVEGCTAEELLKCITADDYDACIAACAGDEEGEETTGNGFVTVKWKAAATQEVARNAVNKNIWTMTLKAGEYDTTVSSVVIKHSWLGDATAVSVQLFQNGVAVTSQKAISKSSQQVTLKLSPAIVMKAGSSMTFDVVASLDGESNETHNFSIEDVNVANGTAEGTPVSLWTLKTTSYEAWKVSVVLSNGNTNLKAWETDKSIVTVKVTPTKKWRINGITLTKKTWTEDIDELVNNVKAYYNDEVIGTVRVTDEKIVISDLKLDRNAWQSATIELRWDCVFAWGTIPTELAVELNDILAVESNTDENMWTEGSNTETFTVAWADLKLTNKVTKEQTVVPGTSDVELLNVQVTAKSELEINDYEVEFTQPSSAPLAFDLGSCSDWVTSTQAACEAVLCKKSASTSAASTDPVIACGENPIAADEVNAADKIYVARQAAVWTPNFVDNIVTVYIDGDDYEMTGNKLRLQWNKTSFTVSENHPVTIRAVASFNEEAVNVTSYKMQVKLTSAKAANDNTPVAISASPRAWHSTKLQGAGATLKTATKAAPVTNSLFANKEQEIGRFAVKAENDNITIKSLVLAATTLTDDEMAWLFDGNLRLVNAETDEEIDANFEDYDAITNTISVKDMNLDVAKDTTINVAVMADIASITTAPTAVMWKSFTLSVSNVKFKTATTSLATASWTPTCKTYTFRATAPVITLEKASDNMFKVTIKNEDENDKWIVFNNLTYRVRTNTANVDFSWSVCLVDDVNTIVCPANDGIHAINTTTWTNTFAFWTSNTHFFGTLVGTTYTPRNVKLDKNEEVSYYILIDGTSIEPDILRAEVSSLSYKEWADATSVTDTTYLTTPDAERYNVSMMLND